ncbi:uncharacterized protein LOC116110977 [Pistacia vera]|uniref:uncharacterized protein LOC116110977 n=1 Tax=Pistacia vera TaxID=55513 RepID=UPI0012631226|nr:uncharacterized protein LOC116110977 [Pistacia vera]
MYCFFLAAASGRVEPVKLMFGKNIELPSIRGHDEMLPIQITTQGDYKEMVTYLYGVTKDKLTEDDLIELLPNLIARVDLFDVALNLLDEYRSLATKSLMGRTALHVLAGAPMMSRDSANQIQQGILKRCFNLFSGSKKLPHEKLPSKALKLAKLLLDKVDCRDNRIQYVIKVAVEEENIEFLSLIICDYPELICKIDRDTCGKTRRMV